MVRGKSSPLLLKQAELAKIELNRLRGKLFNQIQGLRCKLLMNSRENSMLRAPLSVLRGRLSVQFSREFTSFACSVDRESCLLTALLPLTSYLIKLCQPCVTRVTLEKGCKRPVHRGCVSVSTYNSKITIVLVMWFYRYRSNQLLCQDAL